MADKAYDGPRGAGDYAGHPAKSQPQDQAGLRFYRERNLIERFFNKIKHFRAIATRYDKLATNFLAAVQLVAAIILLN
jgi:transposase